MFFPGLTCHDARVLVHCLNFQRFLGPPHYFIHNIYTEELRPICSSFLYGTFCHFNAPTIPPYTVNVDMAQNHTLWFPDLSHHCTVEYCPNGVLDRAPAQWVEFEATSPRAWLISIVFSTLKPSKFLSSINDTLLLFIPY